MTGSVRFTLGALHTMTMFMIAMRTNAWGEFGADIMLSRVTKVMELVQNAISQVGAVRVHFT